MWIHLLLMKYTVCSSHVTCWCMEMALLCILKKYNRYMSHFIGLVHINEIRSCGSHTNYTFLQVIYWCYYMAFVPFAKLQVTRCLYHLHNCKLRGSYNDITYRSRLCLQTSIVSVSISFLHISVDIAFWVSLQLIALQLNRGCSFS